MFVCLHQNEVLFKMKFNDKFDFVHKFRGINDYNISYNAPSDYTEVGLTQNADCWRIDIPFINATDEATPIHANDSFIGANHGHHGAVSVYAKNHDKTFADIGSVWTDDNGAKFTLLRVVNQEWLLFLSENVGASVDNYAFVTTITGKLTYLSGGVNKSAVEIEKQQVIDLRRANRYLRKEVYAITKDKEELVTFVADNCDYAEIREKYYIINPATIAEEITKNRPATGYASNPDLALFGTPMVSVENIYRILPDACVLTDFTYTVLADVKIDRILGVMAQEKRDVFHGGVYRYMPKTLPIKTSEGTFDFGSRVALSGAYPSLKYVSEEYWENPDSPCERIVDYFKDAEGKDKMAFAIGFLPVYDGKPQIRKDNTTHSIMLYRTKKLYPTFASENKKRYHGVGYKKYFETQKDQASFYTVEFDKKTYLYADFFKNETLTVFLNDKTPILLEKSANTSYYVENNDLIISSNKGFASFVLE